MKFLNGENYVEVKDHQYRIHPTEKISLRKRDPPKSLRTQYQVQNNTQINKNQKVVGNNKKLEVKNYSKHKKQPVVQQSKFKPPNCLSWKRMNWLEFDKSYYCKICEYNMLINKNIRLRKKVRRQFQCFSTRLPYADKKIGEI